MTTPRLDPPLRNDALLRNDTPTVAGAPTGAPGETVPAAREVDVVVVGAGQAGLAVAHHLARRGLRPGRDMVVLDAEDAPGGAWRHRVPWLTLGGAHRVADLPGEPLGPVDPDRPAREVVPEYFARYERRFDLDVQRPVKVLEVTDADPGPRAARPPGPGSRATLPPTSASGPGRLVVRADAGTWSTRVLVNATGTWGRPFVPHVPGAETFTGLQVHSRDLEDPGALAGRRVVVVGAGTSGVQSVLRLEAAGAEVTWVARRPPRWVERPFDAEWGREVEEKVAERVRRGLVPTSVVEATGLPLTPEYRAAVDRGVLVARPMFTAMDARHVRWGSRAVEVDAVVWATGYRPALGHLAGLHLREPGGGIRLEGTAAARDPRVHLLGYGPSASTVGAGWSGRRAAAAVARFLEGVADGKGPDGGKGSATGEARDCETAGVEATP